MIFIFLKLQEEDYLDGKLYVDLDLDDEEVLAAIDKIYMECVLESCLQIKLDPWDSNHLLIQFPDQRSRLCIPTVIEY